MPAAITGIREVLVFAENEGKVVTVTAGSAIVTGKILRVNPLVMESQDKATITVLNFDAVVSVSTQQATGEEIVAACKPQPEARFVTERKF